MLLLGVVQAQAAGDEFVSSYDLLATEILTGTAASVTFSSLGDYATDYQHLQLRTVVRDTGAFDSASVEVQLNSDTGSNYAYHFLRVNAGSVTSSNAINQTFIQTALFSGNNAPTGTFGAGVIDILDPFETTKFTTLRTLFGYTGTDPRVGLQSGLWRNTNALTSILLRTNGTSFAIGSRFSLYGIKAV
jgi:hypothetical protein